MQKGIPMSHMEAFWQHLRIDHIWPYAAETEPTSDKVVGAIVAANEHLSAEKERSLYYKKEFVAGLNHDSLANFFLFCTTSAHQPNEIKVSFNALIGTQ